MELLNMDKLVFAGIIFLGVLVLGIIFSRLYRRSSKERSFVRTGLGGQKVVMDGGALVFPVFHETILVNMNTLKLEVMRFGKDSLFTKDRMRVDVVVAFFVRVVPTKEGIANAAQTLGQRTIDPEQLSQLVEDKFVDALRAAAVSMTMQELLDKRQDFIQGVQNAVSEDLLKNGLELESVSLTRIDQTAMQFFDPNNAFDAEGLTRLTEQTQRRSKERNEIEQDTTVAISRKNFEAKQLQLEIDRQKRFAELAQLQEVAGREAEQAAFVAKVQAEKTREGEEASLQEKLALIQGLPRIIEQAVKPMQNIDSIRIMQVDGLNTGTAAAHTGDGANGAGAGNLAEQAVGAALRYRAYAPVVDQLIREVGLAGDGLGGLVKVAHSAAQPAVVPAKTSAPAQG